MAPASRLSLGTRIAILVVLSLGVIFSLFGYLSLRSLQESSTQGLQERLMAAQLSARDIDSFLTVYLDMLSASTQDGQLDPSDPNLEPKRRLLEQLYGPLAGPSRALLLTDVSGNPIWAEPAAARLDPTEPAVRALAASVAKNGRRGVSEGFTDRLGRMLVALAVPVLDRQSASAGALVLVLDLAGPMLSGFVQPVSLGQTGYAEIVDRKGTVLASSNPSLLFHKSDHTDQFADMIEAGRPAVGGCHSCHESAGEGEVQPDILAFAPLSVAPWGVSIRQAEAEVLAPTRALRRSLIGVSILALVAAAALVWLMTRVVVGPVRGLTGAARRIAAGDLESPVACSGPAEIGDLAREFDEMRQELHGCLCKMEQVKAGLEERVEQRTRQLSALLDKVIVAQEEERRRVARELHDETCQALAALAIRLEGVEESLPEAAREARDELDKVKEQLRAALAGVRTLALNLRPSVLDDLGLLMAIDWYAKEQISRRGLEVKLELDATTPSLPPSLETVLFRITQEALNNVLKHSGSPTATVRLGPRDPGVVVLEVEDQGVGFDVERVFGPDAPRDCLGLHGMRERASLCGGSLTLLSAPGHGTLIRVELPIHQTRDGHGEEDLSAVGGRS
jgi:signal transduction histidine kinase